MAQTGGGQALMNVGKALLLYAPAAALGWAVMLLLARSEGVLSAEVRNTVGLENPAMLESYRAEAAGALAGWILATVGLAFLLAAAFLVVVSLARPRTPAEESGAGGLWWGLLIGTAALVGGWSWWTLAAQGAATDLNGLWIGSAALAAVLLLLLAYWLSTAWFTPDGMKPSVPGGWRFARGGRR